MTPERAMLLALGEARRASGRTSISSASRAYWPATKPGTIPEYTATG